MQETMKSRNSDRTQKWMSEIVGCRDDDEIDNKVDLFMAECEGAEPPFLSDLRVGVSNGGQPVMIALGARELSELEMSDDDRFRWKIKVLRDVWGNMPSPGDFVERKVQQNLYKKEGIPVPSTEMSAAKVNGSFSKKYEKVYKYKVDAKGCISCGYTAAMYFLNNYGVHPVTGYAITTKPEFTTDVKVTPSGQKLHAWYWRYKEMDAEMYASLPDVPTSNDPKRGHKK